MKVHCFKHRGGLTRAERICLSSFLVHHDEVNLLCYEPIKNVPDGVQQIDAGEIVPRNSDGFRLNSASGIEALVRWKTLYERGGSYISTDIMCVRPLHFETPVVFGKKCDLDSCRWGIDILIFPPGHEACLFMLKRCLKPHAHLPGEKTGHWIKKELKKRLTRSLRPVKSWMIGGQYGFQAAVEQLRLAEFEQPAPVFYPIHEARWRSPYDSTFENDLELLRSTRAFALNTHQAKRSGFDLNAPYLEGSLMHHFENTLLHNLVPVAA